MKDIIYITPKNKIYLWKDNNRYVFGFTLVCYL